MNPGTPLPSPPTVSPLALHHYYRSGGASTGGHSPLVLIHGWGSDSSVWRELIPLLQQRFDVISVDLPGFGASPPCSWQLEELLRQLADTLPEKVILAGWSLGGMVATAFADQYPQRVEILITMATNPSFVCRDDWPHAMAAPLFQAFRDYFQRDEINCLKQFAALQVKGDSLERNTLRALRGLPVNSPHSGWGDALQLLGSLDNRQALARLTVPSLHLFGAADQLVPVTVAEDICRSNDSLAIHIFDDVAHVPQLSAPDRLAQAMIQFVEQQTPCADGYHMDKARIAESFSRAAATYDQVAHLQQGVGRDLLNLVPATLNPATLVDLGCGTGYFSGQLMARFPAALCMGIDLAQGMVTYARDHRPADMHWICGDAEAMPVASATIDLLFSNFALQWCQDMDALMAELYRVLKNDGVLVFSSVGPASLGELRQAWQVVDNYVHVNRFTPVENLQKALQKAGFTTDLISTDKRVNFYPQLRELTRELKGLGAHNVNSGRNSGLTGRRHIEALKQAYESRRTARGLPATWEIVTVVASKRGPGQ